MSTRPRTKQRERDEARVQKDQASKTLADVTHVWLEKFPAAIVREYSAMSRCVIFLAEGQRQVTFCMNTELETLAEALERKRSTQEK